MDAAELLTRVAAELALFAGIGFLLFAINDLAVDIIYFYRRAWRSARIYSRYPRAFASQLVSPGKPGFMAILVPAWDEAAGRTAGCDTLYTDDKNLIARAKLCGMKTVRLCDLPIPDSARQGKLALEAHEELPEVEDEEIDETSDPDETEA